jgi:hypothetical protein
MASTLDLGAFSSAEKSALLSAAKAEVLARFQGRVSSGSEGGGNFSVTLFSNDELTRLINALTEELGLSSVETRVRPTFTSWQNSQT